MWRVLNNAGNSYSPGVYGLSAWKLQRQGVTLIALALYIILVMVTTVKAEKMDIFVLSGQSNMAGRGGVHGSRWDNFLPEECHPHPSIFRFNSHLQWEQARDPLHADIDKRKVCGIGPGMIFANTILKHYNDTEKTRIGLVPCAIGGTTIKEWQKGSTLYNNMITRTRAALNHGGVLRAILWHHGESDKDYEKNANSYKHNLERLIHDIRADLQHSDLLFIQALRRIARVYGRDLDELEHHIEQKEEERKEDTEEINQRVLELEDKLGKQKDKNARMEEKIVVFGSHLVQLQHRMENLETGNNLESAGFLQSPSLEANSGFVGPHLAQVAIAVGDPPYSKLVQKVREAQLGVSIPNVYCADSKGLPHNEDKLHLITESQVKLGKMLADVYENHKISDKSYSLAVHTICDEKEIAFVQDDPIDCTECS